MKFGVREIANVVFRAKTSMKIGNTTFEQGQPVFYLDTAKTSSMEGAATTVYATGGRGNVRLIAWEGQRTLTFTVEDALLSPISFAMLSGAGVIKGASDSQKLIHFHQTTTAQTDSKGWINLKDALLPNETICDKAPIYVMALDKGDLTGTVYKYRVVSTIPEQNDNIHTSANGWEGNKCLAPIDSTQGTGSNNTILGRIYGVVANTDPVKKEVVDGITVLVDYYVLKSDNTVTELQIDMEHFGGYYYVEADTLFRNQVDGKDYPANLTFPNVKIQSNFTFSMAATGDPSTFTFTMDAFPGYTYFNEADKVLCAIQVADENLDLVGTRNTVFPHETGETFQESTKDSSPAAGNVVG